MKVPHGKSAVNSTYGVPYNSNLTVNLSWYSKNIIGLKPPYPMRLAWDTSTQVKTIACHKLVAPQLEKVFLEIWNYCRLIIKQKYGYNQTTAWYDEKTLNLIKVLRLDLYGGAYNFRKKRGGSSLSTHSWGIAIDIDPSNNGLGNSRYTMPMWVVEIFERHGFFWGGRWKGRNVDAMHFQLCTGM